MRKTCSDRIYYMKKTPLRRRRWPKREVKGVLIQQTWCTKWNIRGKGERSKWRECDPFEDFYKTKYQIIQKLKSSASISQKGFVNKDLHVTICIPTRTARITWIMEHATLVTALTDTEKTVSSLKVEKAVRESLAVPTFTEPARSQQRKMTRKAQMKKRLRSLKSP